MLTTKSHAGYAPVRAALHLAPQAGRSLSRIIRTLWLIAGLGVGGVVWGQTVWTGTTGDWLTAGNWNNGVPTGSTGATIGNGGIASLAGSGNAGTLTIGNNGALSVAGTLAISGAFTNTGTFNIAGVLSGTGMITNQGLIQALPTAVGMPATITNPLTNTSSGTVSVPLGRSLTLSGPVNNSGTLSVAGTPTLSSDLKLTGTVINTGTLDVAGAMTFAGPVTNTGNATVSGQLYFSGGGTSTGPIALAGGVVGFGSTTFSVPNAATSITGSGGLTFGAGTTTLDYGISNAPLTVTQSLGFSGGTLVLPGATSLRASVLALASSGQTPDLPTTVLANGTFIWNGGSVRNTLILEPGVKTTDTGWDTVNFVDPASLVAGVRFGGGHTINGTLINRSSTLSFQSTVGGFGFGGSGTLRNEGTVAINTGASSWTPTVQNVGTATLAGHFTTVNNAGSLTVAASAAVTQITTLTQTAGTTTFSGFQLVGGQTWDIQAGSTLATPDGAWLTVGSLANAGTLDFTGPTTVENPMQNLAGGVVHITGSMHTISPFLLQNQGTIILDGPLAKIWILISGVLGGTATSSSEQLATLAGGTLDIRNGANLTLSNGIGAAANLVVGNGSTLSQTGGNLSGAISLLNLGTFNWAGGSWNAVGATTTIAAGATLNLTTANAHDFNGRAIVNNGTLNWSEGAIRASQGGTLVNNATFNDSSTGQMGGTGTSGADLIFTNAANGTYVVSGGVTKTMSVAFTNLGTVDVQSGQLSVGGIVSGGVLSGGTWRVGDGARLNLNSDAAIAQNAATVVLTGAGSVFYGLNSLTSNTGSLSLLGGRAFTTSAAVTNAGALIVGVGSSFSTSSTFTNSGTLNVTGSFSAGGGLTNTGTLGGSGTFTGSLISAGTLSPGNSPGLLTVTGNLTLQGSSQLIMELGGLVEGVSYDSIDVSGIMALNGGLNVLLVNGFVPTTGATFNLFDASSFTGTFSSMSLPTLTTGLTWNSSALYATGIISVTGTAIPEPSTYAALAGLGALGFVLLRRRRAAA